MCVFLAQSVSLVALGLLFNKSACPFKRFSDINVKTSFSDFSY